MNYSVSGETWRQVIEIWGASATGKCAIVIVALMLSLIAFTIIGALFEQTFLELEASVLSVMRLCTTTMGRPFPQFLQRRQVNALLDQWSRDVNPRSPLFEDSYVLAKMHEVVMPDPSIRRLSAQERRLLAFGAAQVVMKKINSASDGRKLVDVIESFSQGVTGKNQRSPGADQASP